MTESPSRLTSTEYEMIRAVVRARTGVVLDPERVDVAEARLAAVASKLGLSSVAELARRLRGQRAGVDEGLETRVAEAMLIGETSFFREPAVFEALATEVLPAAIARAAARPVHVWSAACATGQEPYSVAMLALERFPHATCRVTASDISESSLAKARDGSYDRLSVNRGLPAALLLKYFHQERGRWRVAPAVRRMVDFQRIDVVRGAAPEPADVILLRNLLIYFDVPTKRAVVARARSCLRPGGCLFLGAADGAVGIDDELEQVRAKGVIFFRKRD